jgi:prophage regulatory protein
MLNRIEEKQIPEPPDRIVGEPECKQMTNLSRAQRWRLEKADRFPLRRVLGRRTVGWFLSELVEWLQALPTDRQTDIHREQPENWLAPRRDEAQKARKRIADRRKERAASSPIRDRAAKRAASSPSANLPTAEHESPGRPRARKRAATAEPANEPAG